MESEKAPQETLLIPVIWRSSEGWNERDLVALRDELDIDIGHVALRL